MSSSSLTLVVVAAKTATLLAGGLVASTAFRAYRQTESHALRLLTGGFALVTAGSLLAGILDQFVAVDTTTALVVESVLMALGFSVIAYSLYSS